MAIQKKHGKGRLDKWYKLAKEKGYRARAAFKLIQLNQKYHFLEKSKVVIDLCAAPGSWCQVASEVCPANALIIGVDLAPIRAIPRCITFQSDITSDKCRATIRQHLKTWKADTVLHDGAPNVGTAWVQDAFSQAELVLQSLKLATEFLVEGGTFVTKVFRSKDYNPLLWVFNQLFTKVEATKPPSSRNVSAEIFVVCRGYKAPKRIDPKFLDARSVFAELADPTPNNEAKVFNPEVKKRKRDGYEEGNYTQFKEIPASQFIQSTDPIAILGGMNKLSFEQPPNGDIALATLDKLPETTEEIRNCCADLRVLGRKEFRLLLKWRLRVREVFGFASKKTKVEQDKEAAKEQEAEEVARVENMDEEMKLQEDMEKLKERESKKVRKERRRENERKQKDIVRMQLHMTTPVELGLEQNGPLGAESMFNLKAVDKAGAISKIAKGKMTIVEEKPKEEDEVEEDSDSDGDALERQLDDMYEQYVEKQATRDPKYRVKKARLEQGDGEWNGIEDNEEEESDEEAFVEEPESDSDSDSDDEADPQPKSLISKLGVDQSTNGALSRRAELFFDQDIFKDIGVEADIDEDSGIEMEDVEETSAAKQTTDAVAGAEPESDNDSFAEFDSEAASDDGSEGSYGFEVVKRDEEEEENWDENAREPKKGQTDIDIVTAEAMTLAHQLATGAKRPEDLIDDGFNKYALRDTEGLPEWFLDDENKHSRQQRPITKAAAQAIKDKMRAFNARPIKKVREAKARKKFKAAQRLEKMKKKSAVMLEDEAMDESDKAKAIARMVSRATKSKPKQSVKLVVARGGNRGISGRPKGTKGRYKMVDARMKKDMRALKRLKKKTKR
ncbi:AdoMet-dependent rRNA methyltransferase SPB1 [Trichodelitschia bisporula]|uniref:AdoMet-dependent rRNA methyltransferase SPB1 n=1 Tax=Trichodelitschia bisporula TaxID=703511 RepID=A0A6G1HPH8_9PEZI|nr:AdoMet-dependent rRNA methyltransferase SPB1 [Trichodelitschia bisporula]